MSATINEALDRVEADQLRRSLNERPPASTRAAAPLTLRQAQALLADTSQLSDRQLQQANGVVQAFFDSKPRGACRACSSGLWAKHMGADGEYGWDCQRCHRPPMTDDAYAKYLRDEAEKAEAKIQEAAAAEKRERDYRGELAAAKNRRAAAQAALDKLDAAVTASRDIADKARADGNR